MSDFVTLRTNLPDFKRQLQALKQEAQSKAARGANVAAASVFRAAIRNQVKTGDKPRSRTGALFAAVYIKRSRRSTTGAERHYVGIKGRAFSRTRKGVKSTMAGAFYWRFLEGGWIARGPGGKIGGGERARGLTRSRMRESGATFYRYQFIQPAFEAARGSAVNAFEKRMTREIEKLSAKR